MQVESGAHTEADEDSDYLASADLEDDDDLDADADFIAEDEHSPDPNGEPLSIRPVRTFWHAPADTHYDSEILMATMHHCRGWGPFPHHT